MNGILEQTPAGPRLRFERHLAHPPEKVWRAITEPEQLRAWFPQTVTVAEWAVGAPVHFEHERRGEVGTYDGEVLAYEPLSHLEFSWGTDTIRLEIEPDGDGTKLTLLDTLDELGKAARDGAGWHACLDGLEAHLDERPAVDSGERWAEVHPGYVEAFGPEAATIGPPG